MVTVTVVVKGMNNVQVARIQGDIRSVERSLSETQGQAASSLQRGSPGLLTSITTREPGLGERPSRWEGLPV
jgi:hypothetical protein